MAKQKKTTKTRYKALIGFNYGKDDTRVEVGEIVDLPPITAKNLLSQNAIKEVE